MKRTIVLLFGLCFLWGCRRSEFFTPEIRDTCKVVTIDVNSDSAYFKCIKDISLIPLEVNAKSWYLINPIMLNPNDSTIVLVDKYDGMMAGYVHCKNTFGRRYIGRGHGEFIEFGNAFSFDSIIGIYDCSSAKCLYYDTNGDYVSEIVLKDRYCDQFYQISKESSVGFNVNKGWGDGGYYCNLYDNEKGKISSSDLYLSELHSMIVDNDFPISVHEGILSFYIDYGYVIYGIMPGSKEVFQQYYLDLNNKLTKAMVHDKLKSPFLLDEVLASGASGDISDFLETDRFFSFSTVYERSSYKVLLDKQENKCYSFDIFHGAKNDDPFINQLFKILIPVGSCKNELYMYCNYKSFYAIENRSVKQFEEQERTILNQVHNYSKQFSLDDDSKLFFKITLID